MQREVKGILGTKLGMTQVWDNNRVVPVTVVQADPNVVTQVRTADKDGYSAVQLAFGAIDPRKVNKPTTGHYDKAEVAPRRHIVELRTTDASEYTLGQEVTAGCALRLREVAGLRLVDLAGVDRAVRELHGGVPVRVLGAYLGHDARAGLHHGHRDNAVVVPDLGHAELGAQDPLHLPVHSPVPTA